MNKGGMKEQCVETNHQTRLAVNGAVSAAGVFEILAITAGEGNGWQFSAAVLRESLGLWDGVECFADHTTRPDGGRSVRDLAGVVAQPAWDAASQGVRCTLRALGPAGKLLADLGAELLAQPPAAPRVGFSADVIFTARGRVVERIVKVLSVDLVLHPARGGAFLSAQPGPSSHQDTQLSEVRHQAGNQHGGAAMTEENTQEKQAGVIQAQMAGTPAAGAGVNGSTGDETATVRAEMCKYLLESGLAAARLPAPLTERVRKQFAGKAFEPAELTQAIEDARKLASELTGGRAVQGVSGSRGRVSAMFSSEDQFSAALYDLLGAERPEEIRGAKVARLSGIRELYTLMTGDLSFSGGYDAARAQFAVTTDLPGVLKNAMNKLILQEWDELGRSGYRWWEPLVSVQHFNSLQPVTGILVGEITLLPSVAEGAAYTALPVKDSAESGDWAKYGGYIGLTLEMFERDETHKLRQYPRKLAAASLRRISSLVGTVFTGSGGAGPTMADGYNVFETAHHANLGTTALASASWEAASAAIYNQPLLVGSGTAPKQAVDARYLIVPRALRLTGWQLLYPSFAHEANFFSDNLQKGQQGDVITCPEFTDANDWAAAADPRIAPGIILCERFGVQPEIVIAADQQQGALFTNDELRMKVRHWVSVFVADYRPLYKANVA